MGNNYTVCSVECKVYDNLNNIFWYANSAESMFVLIESYALLISWNKIQHGLLCSLASSNMLFRMLIGSLVLPSESPAQFNRDIMSCVEKTWVSLLLIVFVNIFFMVSSSVMGRVRLRSCSQLDFFGMGYIILCCHFLGICYVVIMLWR